MKITFDIEVDEEGMQQYHNDNPVTGKEYTAGEILIGEAVSAWEYEDLILNFETQVEEVPTSEDLTPCPCRGERSGPVLHMVGETCCQ